MEQMSKSRSTAVLRATNSSKPVPPTPQPQKTLKSSFAATSGKKTNQKQQYGLGPGQYNAECATSLVKTRSQSALMSKLSRPDITKRTTAATGDLGPGAYDAGKTFGKDVIGYSWGKPKPPKKEVDKRDYGYTPEKEFNATRHRSPSALINGKSPSRPESFANQG